MTTVYSMGICAASSLLWGFFVFFSGLGAVTDGISNRCIIVDTISIDSVAIDTVSSCVSLRPGWFLGWLALWAYRSVLPKNGQAMPG